MFYFVFYGFYWFFYTAKATYAKNFRFSRAFRVRKKKTQLLCVSAFENPS